MRRNMTDRPRGTFLTWYSAEERGHRFVDYIEKNFKSEHVSFADHKGIHLFEEFKLDVISAECWTATPLMFDGLALCAVYGLLNDMDYMIACESDMHAAITMVLLKAATLGEGKPLFGEFTVRHPQNKNGELL